MGQFSKMGNSSPPYQSCDRRSHRRRICSQHYARTATLRRRSWRTRAIRPHMAANYRARQSYPGEQRMADSPPQKKEIRFFPRSPPRWYQTPVPPVVPEKAIYLVPAVVPKHAFLWFPRWYYLLYLGRKHPKPAKAKPEGRNSKTPNSTICL